MKVWERARAATPDAILPRQLLIQYYVSVDRLESARAIVPEILAVNPDLTAEVLARHGPFRPPEDQLLPTQRDAELVGAIGSRSSG